MIQKKFYKEDFVLKYNNIDWTESKGRCFRVEYDNNTYMLTYIECINKNYVKVEYNGKEFVLTKSALLNGYIGRVIDNTHYGFRYNVGDIINGRIVLEQIKKKKINNSHEKRYKVKCLKDNYCYEITEIMLKNNSKCPVCCNRILMIGVNDLWSKRSDIAKMLYDKTEGYKYLSSSNHKTIWVCQCCGSLVHGKSIYNVCKNNTVYCPFCNDGFSYPEKLMNAILTYSKIIYTYHFSFEDQFFYYNNKPYHPEYDFYFIYKSKKYIIEMDGGFHYKQTNGHFEYSLEEIQEIDRLKDELALKNGCEVIRIDCCRSEYSYILNSLKKSKLSDIINFDNLNSYEINKNACSSKIKEICNIYMNNTKILPEISERTKVNRYTVYNYLRLGTQIGLCDYNPNKITYSKGSRKVICLNNKTFYSSISEASKITGINPSLISGCCKNKYITGGTDKEGNYLIWMYKEDYQNLINDKIEIDSYIIQRLNKRWTTLSKQVICLNTLDIFDISSASKWCSVSKTSLSACCRGETRTSGMHPKTGERLQWMYYNEYLKLNNINT